MRPSVIILNDQQSNKDKSSLKQRGQENSEPARESYHMDVRVRIGHQEKALPDPSNNFTWSGAPHFLLMDTVGRKHLEKSIWKDKSQPQAKADAGREQQLRTLRGEEMLQGRRSQLLAVPRCWGRTSQLLTRPSVTPLTHPEERLAELSSQLLLSLTGLGVGEIREGKIKEKKKGESSCPMAAFGVPTGFNLELLVFSLPLPTTGFPHHFFHHSRRITHHPSPSPNLFPQPCLPYSIHSTQPGAASEHPCYRDEATSSTPRKCWEPPAPGVDPSTLRQALWQQKAPRG